MKIFNKEYGTKVVYVQLYDIIYANKFCPNLPLKLAEMANKYGLASKHNSDKFFRFEDEGVINFVEHADWIIDFKYYKDMRAEDLQAEYNKLRDKINQLVQDYNSELQTQNRQEGKKNLELDTRLKHIELLKDKLNQFPNLILLKQGLITIPFPLVPDSDGFEIYCENYSPYIAYQGINPLQILIAKKNGEPFLEEEKISENFREAAEGLLISTILEVNEFFNNATPEIDYSEDHRYFVITYHITTPKEDLDNKHLKSSKDGHIFKLSKLFNKFKG